MLLALLFASVSLVWAADSSFNVYHRVYEPNQPESPFTARGTILIPASGHASFEPSSSLSQDLTQLAHKLQTVKGALYQVALELDGDARPGQWDAVSAVKIVNQSSLGLERPRLNHSVHSVTSIKPPPKRLFCMQRTRAGRTL